MGDWRGGGGNQRAAPNPLKKLLLVSTSNKGGTGLRVLRFRVLLLSYDEGVMKKKCRLQEGRSPQQVIRRRFWTVRILFSSFFFSYIFFVLDWRQAIYTTLGKSQFGTSKVFILLLRGTVGTRFCMKF